MPTIWIDTIIGLVAGSGAGVNTSLMTGVSSTQTRFDRMTLLRTIVGVDVGYSVHDAGEGSQNIHLGIGVTSQEAFAAGALADPETATDFPARGWIWRWSGRVFGFAADQPAVFTRRIDIDLRSKRKLENGEVYAAFTNLPHEGSASSVDVTGLIRQLWLVG